MLRLCELKASLLVSLLASTGCHPDSHSGVWWGLCPLYTQAGGCQRTQPERGLRHVCDNSRRVGTRERVREEVLCSDQHAARETTLKTSSRALAGVLRG